MRAVAVRFAGANKLPVLLLATAISLLILFPGFSHAQIPQQSFSSSGGFGGSGTEITGADYQCNPVIPVCPCGQTMQGTPPKCTFTGMQSNMFMCACQQSDGSSFSTSGQCVSANKCLAKSTSGQNGGQQNANGLSQLGQLLGQLLSKLGQSSGSGSGSSASPTTGCTSSYYFTSNTSLIGVDPCAEYQPAGTSCTDPTATNYGAAATCTYASGVGASTSAQSLLTDLTGITGSATSTTTTTSPGLSASPTGGSTPLAVTFTTTPISSSDSYTIDPGDGSGPQTAAAVGSCSSASNSTCVYSITYTYTTPGTYTAILSDSSGDQLATVSVPVTNPNGASSSGSTLTNVFNTVGGLFTGTSTQGLTGQTSTNFPGIFGNILLGQNGATIFASTINSANNSETSGFYGSDTLGGQSQGVVSQLCQGRPWASNFLANIIPPSFFDSLCQWGGFQVGQSAPQPQPTAQVTLTQQTSSAPAATQQAPAATSTTPAVAAQAVIWAVPASVPLGTRTSIFWNTQGVTQCTETSPDGSFNESSLSGAAATVPLTEATTYTISCLDPNGNPITNYVTVNISS